MVEENIKELDFNEEYRTTFDDFLPEDEEEWEEEDPEDYIYLDD